MRSVPPVHALIVVDMQRAFVAGPDASPRMPTVLPAIQEQLGNARSAAAVVVHVQNDGEPGTLDEPGTAGWELALEGRPGETVVRKDEDNAFATGELHELLRHRGVETVSICGVMSEMCVAATARAAMELDYTVVLAHDSHGTYPVPAYAPGEPEVPAELAARAAEWSLGDTVVIPPTAADVRFTAPRRGPNE